MEDTVTAGKPIPTNKQVIYNKLPIDIKDILITTEGWLVGGSIKDILEGNRPKDYDIIIPSREKFQNTMLHLHSFEYSFNTYGGIKFQLANLTVDIWCEELSHFLMNANKLTYVYNMRKNILLDVQ